ncbi:MAG: methyltransferase domain-containing protein [Pseudohongiellaceae bacterium]
MNKSVGYIHIAFLLFASAGLLAQGAPGINDGYRNEGTPIEVWVDRFEVEGREVFDLRNEIVTVLNMAPGSAVADVGAGTGLFTPLLADAVGTSGKIYAVDIIPAFIEHIDEKIQEHELTQVETVLGTETSGITWVG